MTPQRTDVSRAARVRALLADERQRARAAVAGFRPARLLKVGYGIVVALGVVVLAGLGPLMVQRIVTSAETEIANVGAFITAVALTVLAQASVVYIVSLLLAYVTAEVFVPRDGVRLRGPRALIWRSLHRLGNAASIALVLTVSGTAIGIAVFGDLLHDDAAQDSPGELAGMQLGTLLIVVTVVLMYESIRICVDLLATLPALWRWASAFVYPFAACVVIYFAMPTWDVVMRVFAQWTPRQDVEQLGFSGPLWGPLSALAVTVILWITAFIRAGDARRLVLALRG